MRSRWPSTLRWLSASADALGFSAAISFRVSSAWRRCTGRNSTVVWKSAHGAAFGCGSAVVRGRSSRWEGRPRRGEMLFHPLGVCSWSVVIERQALAVNIDPCAAVGFERLS